jgi:hypothetical protein
MFPLGVISKGQSGLPKVLELLFNAADDGGDYR